MYSEVVISVIFFGCGVLGGTDVIRKGVARVKALSQFVSLTETDPLIIAYQTAKLTCHAAAVSILNLSNEDTSVGKNTYEVSYRLLGKNYKMLVKVRRGPCPINTILDEDGRDITNKVLPYMGPKFDWHGQRPDPSFFKCETLNIERLDGTLEIISNKKD